jgi:transposase-like protein
VLEDLRRRGATQIDLIVTDGHDGRLSAVKALFTATPRQRCLVHKQRNVMSAIPRRERGNIQVELMGIWEQPTKEEAMTQLAVFKAKYSKRYPEAVRSLAEDEEHTLTFFAFPQTMHRYLKTTNAIESLASQCKATHRSDRHVYHGDQLSRDCLGDDPGYPLAYNLLVIHITREHCS